MALSQNTKRYPAIDALRGTVMIIMALDHIRDFVNNSAMSFSPEDLSRTTPALFFTRWITHFCAPVFMFTAGMGAYFWWQRQKHSKSELSTFLWTRGVWLILLELTAMRIVLNMNFSPRFPIFLTILWAIGASMIILAALVYLPMRALAAFSIAVIILHNLLDGMKLPALHQRGIFQLDHYTFILAYPLIPWFAVMAAGFCFAPFFGGRLTLKLGIILTAAFFVLRAVNIYGDPSRWTPDRAVLSFLRTTKYPPSLDFLLMTLGPALIYLAWLNRFEFTPANPLIVFGRVPLFFFVGHFYVIRGVVFLLTWLRYGQVGFLFGPLPSMGGAPKSFPPDFGFPLWVVYAVWVGIIVGLYPLCRWFAGVKSERRDWWLSYL